METNMTAIIAIFEALDRASDIEYLGGTVDRISYIHNQTGIEINFIDAVVKLLLAKSIN